MKGRVSVIDDYNSGILNLCSVYISSESMVLLPNVHVRVFAWICTDQANVPICACFHKYMWTDFNIEFVGLFLPVPVWGGRSEGLDHSFSNYSLIDYSQQ